LRQGADLRRPCAGCACAHRTRVPGQPSGIRRTLLARLSRANWPCGDARLEIDIPRFKRVVVACALRTEHWCRGASRQWMTKIPASGECRQTGAREAGNQRSVRAAHATSTTNAARMLDSRRASPHGQTTRISSASSVLRMPEAWLGTRVRCAQAHPAHGRRRSATFRGAERSLQALSFGYFPFRPKRKVTRARSARNASNVLRTTPEAVRGVTPR
jgi:hypothetical protein